ncbi:MAG: YraN family protein [Proteobacteria bacterium]|nr:YraN family protein [Pseudomonadota bacterium]MCH8177451.1 YraN family protein [Pseudomonadota bacterium]
MNWNRRKGLHYESQARDYLVRRGLKLVTENYLCRFGEIDLIMLQQESLCFIEVKYRKNQGYGGAISAIPPQKQRKIVKTALFFVAEHKTLAQRAMRFDALIIQQHAAGDSEVDWIQNAFYAE